MTEGRAINPTAIETMLENTGGDPEFVVEIIGDFLADTSTLLDNLTSACSARDAEAARRVAHSVKGSSANFGATRLADLAAGIEKRCLRSDIDSIEELLPAIRTEFDLVTHALQAEQSHLLETSS